MPRITLTEGDFGKGPAGADAQAFHLPNVELRGATLVIPFAEVAEMTMVGSDNEGRFKAAVRMSIGGIMSLGPVGIAAGLLAVRNAGQTKFTVRLHDGRRFSAVADAAVFADLHAAQIEAAAAGHAHPADAIIAKYITRPSGREEAAAATAVPAAETARQAVDPAGGPASPPLSFGAGRPPAQAFGRRVASCR